MTTISDEGNKRRKAIALSVNGDGARGGRSRSASQTALGLVVVGAAPRVGGRRVRGGGCLVCPPPLGGGEEAAIEADG